MTTTRRTMPRSKRSISPKSRSRPPDGLELNFRDSWKYNVAGYELAKILELNMVPPYVERKLGGQQASLFVVGGRHHDGISSG